MSRSLLRGITCLLWRKCVVLIKARLLCSLLGRISGLVWGKCIVLVKASLLWNETGLLLERIARESCLLRVLCRLLCHWPLFQIN